VSQPHFGHVTSGTPGFASPEAISNQRRKLFDKSSDVFSLACIVVHMITGKPPYVSEAENADGDVLLVLAPPPKLF
jgi:serine/threonine protein kinase